MRSPSTRFRIEAALGRAGVALLVLVLVVPDWIEKLFDLSPDGGDGSVEWGLVLTVALLIAVSFVSAGRTARRQARGTAEAPPTLDRGEAPADPATSDRDPGSAPK